jgi:hypothetical protein
VGVAWDAPSLEEARQSALAACRTGRNGQRMLDPECKVRVAFSRNECVAPYYVKKESGLVFSYAIGTSREDAAAKAMGICRNENPAEASTCGLTEDTLTKKPSIYCQD